MPSHLHEALLLADTARDATQVLDPDRRRLYLDLVLASLSEAAKRELKAMDPAKYEYQSDFAKQYIALGKEEGKQEGKLEGSVQGRAELVSRLLARRFGSLPAAAAERVSAASAAELDAIGDRLLTAGSLAEALGPL